MDSTKTSAITANKASEEWSKTGNSADSQKHSLAVPGVTSTSVEKKKKGTEIVENVMNNLTSLEECMKESRKLIQSKGSKSTIIENRDQMVSTVESLQQAFRELGTMSHDDGNTVPPATLRKLRRKFDAEAKSFEKLKQQIRLLERAKTNTSSTTNQPAKNPFDDGVEYISPPVTSESVVVFVKDEHPDIAIVRERQEDLSKIERDTQALKALSQDVSTLMEKQGEELTVICDTSEKTSVTTQKGAADMLNAVDRRSRRWKRILLFSCIAFTVLAVTASTVLLVLKYVYGHI